MDAALKKILRSVTLTLRHLLEGWYGDDGQWHPGDLEQRLNSLGVWRDREPLPIDELAGLSAEDREARRAVDGYVKLRLDADVGRGEAVAEFVRETAYTWANRLLALRCLEARQLIDEIILQKEAYGGRSLEHHRLRQSEPRLCDGPDDGLFAALERVFGEQAARLPMLFDPHALSTRLRPSPDAIKDCVGLLGLKPEALKKHRITAVRDEGAPPNPFTAPDALGWAYQYWNTEEKDRVFERVRTVKGAKIAGADIIPATQLYTEDYMVKFLVQNSLGATWMGMHPDSRLFESWEYYVRDADRAPAERKPIREVTFLDPACGSGHFLIEAFDLYYAMYVEEGEQDPETICRSILEHNLFGIDIDARAVQIAEAALWMKAGERLLAADRDVAEATFAAKNLVAATASHLKGPAWEEFLGSFEMEPSVARVLGKFAQTMDHIEEIGSLARPAEDLRDIIKEEHAIWERQVRERREANILFPEIRAEVLGGQLRFQEISDDDFGHRLFNRARFALDGFTASARQRGDFDDQMLSAEALAGFRILELLSNRYDIVAANPPYMGSQSMGPYLQKHIVSRWRHAKRDLYAAFIARSVELAQFGRVALVTQQAWLFLKQMHHLRNFILPHLSMEVLAHLGPGAFEEISGAHVNVVLFAGTSSDVGSEHHVTAIRPTWMAGPDAVARQLSQASTQRSSDIRFYTRQQALNDLPGRIFVYWCTPYFLRLLKECQPFNAFADVTYTASANQRFVRFGWEVLIGERWLHYSKGGGFQRWVGLDRYAVDWREDGKAIAADIRDRYEPDKFSLWVKQEPTKSPCVVWSEIGSGSMGARVSVSNTVVSRKGPAVLSRDESDLKRQLVFLNSRAATYLLRLSCSGLEFAYSYVAQLPYPVNEPPLIVEECVDVVLELATHLLKCDIEEYTCDPAFAMTLLASSMNGGGARMQLWSGTAVLHTIEGILEQAAFDAYGVGETDRSAVLADTGTPAGWYPLVKGYDRLPETPVLSGRLVMDVVAWCEEHPHIALTEIQRGDLDDRLKSLYETGAGRVETTVEDPDEVGDDDETAIVGARIPVPSITFLEEVARSVEIHPISGSSGIRALV